MSSVVIAGDTSGTVTLQAPAVSGTTTLTLPATSGTVMVNGPAFSVYASANQSCTATTATKIQLNTKLFDTNTNFDATTNYRFTPTVAGYYQLNGGVAWTNTVTNNSQVYCMIYKNGSLAFYGNILSGVVVTNLLTTVSGLVYLNGSTDYVELYFVTTITQSTISGLGLIYLNGTLARSA